MHWQAIFFDFDGVIADSVEVKVKAFARLFSSYGPAVQEAVVAYHLANGGMPRRQKLCYCLEHIAGQSCDEEKLEELNKAFSDLVVDGVVSSPLLDGVLPTLQLLQKKSIPAYIVSGTPQNEMQYVVEQKKISFYFTEVHGSPRQKPAILKDILIRHSYNPGRCLFVGDALADYRAARETEMAFLGIVAKERPSIFPEDVQISSTVCLPFSG